MKWLARAPKEPGFYWYCDPDRPLLIWMIEATGPFGAAGEMQYTFRGAQPMPSYRERPLTGKWTGPLRPPWPPKPEK
jgi:hypothetical protein